jgi:polysaccharide biosynthesis/export protein
MKNCIKLLIVSILMTILSCRSSQDLVYLKDVVPTDVIKGLPVQTTEHTLKTGDILYVSIKSMNPEINTLFNPESNMEAANYNSFQKYNTPSGAYLYGYEIDEEGNIKLPMLGKVKVAGTAPSKVEAIIQERADKFLNDAIVKVKLLNFKVTVLGEVRVPGIYYNYNNTMTVIDALAQANGNTDFATISKVMVVRLTPEGNKPYLLDLSSKDVYLSDAFYLQPNDCVFVRPDKNKNFSLNSQAWSMTISSISILLAILAFAIK